MTKTKKLLNIILIANVMLFSFGRVYGAIDAVNKALGSIENVIAAIAGFVCVIKVIQIGIMYMLSGAGSKGQAKSALMPWIIGTFICGFYFVIGSKIIEAISSAAGGGGIFSAGDPTGAVNSIGSKILTEFAVLAGAVALGMLIYIGIKYMTSGAIERAQAKNTLVPWVIGLVIAASASSIAGMILSAAQNAKIDDGSSKENTQQTQQQSTTQGQSQ